METLQIKLLQPNAKQLLLDLESQNIISIKERDDTDLLKFLESIKNNPDCDLTMEEISEEVEIVRAERYARSQATSNTVIASNS